MTLIERINLLVDEVGKALKAMRTDIGQKSALKTGEKANLVAAINELADRPTGNGGAVVNDSQAAGDTVYSSEKTEALIAAAKQEISAEIIGGAGAAYDTLKEVADYIETDKTGAAKMAEQIGKRLRTDEAQVLSHEQKTAVETTLNLGNTDTDFAARFKGVLNG